MMKYRKKKNHEILMKCHLKCFFFIRKTRNVLRSQLLLQANYLLLSFIHPCIGKAEKKTSLNGHEN